MHIWLTHRDKTKPGNGIYLNRAGVGFFSDNLSMNL
jgi:hypothetical protein